MDDCLTTAWSEYVGSDFPEEWRLDTTHWSRLMTSFFEDIEAWFKGRPKWLQDATRRLREQGTLYDSDIGELTLICKKEAGVDVDGEEVPEPVGLAEGSLLKGDSSKTIHILSISNPTGINALNPRNPLEFGKSNLVVVYGRNSAGKSGYVRILKHACGARCPGPLYPNISSDGTEEQGCKFNHLAGCTHNIVNLFF